MSNRALAALQRTARRTLADGFIHAGNLAYLAMVTLFPFFILGAALFQVIGGPQQAEALVLAVIANLPPAVAAELRPAALAAVNARSGWVLWLGALVALWTVSSLIETIRDILRRAHDVTTDGTAAFWRYRLGSVGLILASVVAMMLSLFAQVAIGAAQEVILTAFPQLGEVIAWLRLSRLIPAVLLGLSLWALFYSLTPLPYRHGPVPQWPGALVTTGWWIAVATALPVILRYFLSFDLTYGSLAGIMVTLFFFWLIGLGVVIGAEWNAALACAGESGKRAKEVA